MRIAVLSGLFACATIFALNTAKAGANPLHAEEILKSQKPETSVVELLAEVGQPVEEVKKEAKKAEPVEHKIAANESLSDIAKDYKTTWKRLYDKNKSIKNPDVLTVGAKIVIPKNSEKLKERDLPKPPAPEPVATVKAATSTTRSRSTPQKTTASYSAPRGSSSGNLYTAGNCTWYVKSLRPDMPNNLGNASTWVSRAAAQGFATGSKPRVGAVAKRNNHVAYVTKVHKNGTMTITDMNYRALYAVTTRTVPSNQWSFIY